MSNSKSNSPVSPSSSSSKKSNVARSTPLLAKSTRTTIDKPRPTRNSSWTLLPRPSSSGSASLRPVRDLDDKELNEEATALIVNGLQRTESLPTSIRTQPEPRQSLSKMSLSNIMPSLSSLSLSRVNTNDNNNTPDRGRQPVKPKSTASSRESSTVGGFDASRVRSLSPFHRRRSRGRDRSPSVEALRQPSDADSDSESLRKSVRPRNAFNEGSDSENDDDDDEEEDWSEDHFDEETEGNTAQNAAVGAPFDVLEDAYEHEPDPLGEGVNVVRPPEPMFQQTLMAPRRSETKRKKSLKHDVLPLTTGRPHFQRDQCTITLVHGDVEHRSTRSRRTYMVASDLSEESKYAVEWGIGTVLKDGDEMFVVTVNETDSKLDPSTPNPSDKVSKLRNQQDRQALANLLVRQVTGLLQRTRLHVTVKCLAIHAKSSRHTLLDLIDHIDPTMVIVGSRGIGKLKGILLGSTSHYLIQKSSVPIMVARRRLKRTVRKSTGIPPVHTHRVSLRDAAIDKAGPGKVEKDVEQMRQELAQEELARRHQSKLPDNTPLTPISVRAGLAINVPVETGQPDDETDTDSEEEGVKVAGEPSTSRSNTVVESPTTA